MTVRQEIHNYIDDISESKLLALKPLLFALVDESIVIEYDLTDVERLIITHGMKEFEDNSSSFISLDMIN